MKMLSKFGQSFFFHLYAPLEPKTQDPFAIIVSGFNEAERQSLRAEIQEILSRDDVAMTDAWNAAGSNADFQSSTDLRRFLRYVSDRAQ